MHRHNGIGIAVDDLNRHGQMVILCGHFNHMGAKLVHLLGVGATGAAAQGQPGADVFGIAFGRGLRGKDRLNTALHHAFGDKGGDGGDKERTTKP